MARSINSNSINNNNNSGSSRKRCCQCTRNKFAAWMAITGVLLIALGVSISPLVNWLVKSTVNDQLVISDTDSTLYSNWANPSIPIYMTFFMFNVANPQEILKNGAAPVVEEMGPYVYTEVRLKTDITWNEDRTILSYHQHQYYYFNESLSSGKESDPITTANVPLVVLCATVGKVNGAFGFISKEIFDLALLAFPSESYFITKTVGEMLWGYEDPILKYLSLIPSLKLNATFALQQNDSSIDWLNYSRVKTGKDNINDVLEYIEWDGNMNLTYWGDEYANMINGTDASQFAPDVQDSTILQVYVDSIFRSAYLNYKYDVNVEGITLKRFGIADSLLQNATQNPDCAPFYAYGPSGVLNMTTAAGGPLFASKPHFLDGDPIYNINVKGMHPVREWHDTNLDVEPITGALMQAAKRIQLNIEIQKVADIPRTGKVPHVLLPLFYANESAVITADLADDFKSQVYLPITASVAIQWTGIALGSLCLGAFLITVALIIRDRKKDKDSQREPLLDKETRAMHINIPGLA